MGNSLWRLETSINLTILHAKESNFINNLEIIVSDWGSKVPLCEDLSLLPEATGRVKFIHIPEAIALHEQKDSKFPEVIALNTAARRTKGEYIGRIDNDTIIGPNFFRKFLRLYQNNPNNCLDISNSFLFVERKSVPYRISRLSLKPTLIKHFVNLFSNFLKIESATEWGRHFWWSPVGIMMFHRQIWEDTRGYDEKLIYWGWMEGDLALRLEKKHRIIEFSKFVGYDFYHLEHYSNLTDYKDRNGPATSIKKNIPKLKGLHYQVNSEQWGLYKYDLTISNYAGNTKSSKYLLCDCGRLTTAIALLFIDKFIEFINHLKPKIRIFLGRIRLLQ